MFVGFFCVFFFGSYSCLSTFRDIGHLGTHEYSKGSLWCLRQQKYNYKNCTMYFSTNCDRFTKKKKYKLNQIHQFSFKPFHQELCFFFSY